jgi:hypothetical protein
VEIGLGAVPEDHQAICANAELAVTSLSHVVRRPYLPGAATAKEDEIIPRSVVFFKLLRHPVKVGSGTVFEICNPN